MRAHVTFTHINTLKFSWKLNDGRNQPLIKQDDGSNENVTKLKKINLRSFKLYRVYLAKLEFSLKFQGEGTFRFSTESRFTSFLRQMCTERCFAHKTIDVSRMPIYRARTRARFISIFPRFCCCCRRSCLTYLFSFRQHPYTLHSSNNMNYSDFIAGKYSGKVIPVFA